MFYVTIYPLGSYMALRIPNKRMLPTKIIGIPNKEQGEGCKELFMNWDTLNSPGT